MQTYLSGLKIDKGLWEATFTDEERNAAAAFEQSLKTNPEALQAYMTEMDDTFTAADVNADGVLDMAEFKTFINAMNANDVARGLKAREYDSDYWDIIYPTLNTFYSEVDGISKMLILTLFKMLMLDDGPKYNPAIDDFE